MSEIPQFFVGDIELELPIEDIFHEGTLQEQTKSNPPQSNLRPSQLSENFQIRLYNLLHSEVATTPKYSTDS